MYISFDAQVLMAASGRRRRRSTPRLWLSVWTDSGQPSSCVRSQQRQFATHRLHNRRSIPSWRHWTSTWSGPSPLGYCEANWTKSRRIPSMHWCIERRPEARIGRGLPGPGHICNGLNFCFLILYSKVLRRNNNEEFRVISICNISLKNIYFCFPLSN